MDTFQITYHPRLFILARTDFQPPPTFLVTQRAFISPKFSPSTLLPPHSVKFILSLFLLAMQPMIVLQKDQQTSRHRNILHVACVLPRFYQKKSRYDPGWMVGARLGRPMVAYCFISSPFANTYLDQLTPLSTCVLC